MRRRRRRRAPGPTASGPPVAASATGKAGVAVRELSVQLRRGPGGRQRQPRGADGPHHRAGRAERGGQDDDLQRLLGSAQADHGRVLLHDRDVTGDGAGGAVARSGLGRTFQKAELFNSLSVRENVVLGREAAMAGANPITQLVGRRPRSRRRAAGGRRGDGADRDRPALRLSRPGSSPPASAAWSSWPGSWPAPSTCFSWTSPLPGSTPPRRSSSATC